MVYVIKIHNGFETNCRDRKLMAKYLNKVNVKKKKKKSECLNLLDKRHKNGKILQTYDKLTKLISNQKFLST